MTSPLVIPRNRHCISRKDIDPDALKIAYRLIRHGFVAYLVGGGVRDLLLRRTPKDFDIGTTAKPNEIKSLFRNCRIIGKRFRLAHIFFKGQKIIEVATFRRSISEAEIAQLEPSDEKEALRIMNNTFGTPEEDALRRDFTINALFYNPKDFTVIDYVGGLEDLEKGIVRIIGDPNTRLVEDPVRILRAVEFAHRLGFTIHPDTLEAGKIHAKTIATSSKDRIREEFLQIFQQGVSQGYFKTLMDMGVLGHIIPLLESYLPRQRELLWELLDKADYKVKRGKWEDPSLFIAVLLFPELRRRVEFTRQAQLGEVIVKSRELVMELNKQLTLQVAFRARAVELLLGQWRLLRGPERRGARRFMRREEFLPSLELFDIVTLTMPDHRRTFHAWRRAYGQEGIQIRRSDSAAPKKGRRRRPRHRNNPASQGDKPKR